MRNAFRVLTTSLLLLALSPIAFAQPEGDCPSVDAIRSVKFDQSFSVPWRDYVLAIKENAFRTDSKWYFYLLFTNTYSDSDARIKALDYLPNLTLYDGPIKNSSGKGVYCRYAVKDNAGNYNVVGYTFNPPETAPVYSNGK